MTRQENSDQIAVPFEVDPKVDQAVQWLQGQKALMEKELTRFAQKIGEYLLIEFFDGDILQVASQNPNKSISFRRLCSRADLPFSESSLRRFLQVAVNFRLLPQRQAEKLLPSHHSVLYQVADADERKKIARKAADEGLSVRKLRELVKGKGKRRPGGGRKPKPDFARDWEQLLSVLESLSDQTAKDGFLDKCGSGDFGEDCTEIRRRLAQIIDRVERVVEDREGKEEAK